MAEHPTLNEMEDGYVQDGVPVFGKTFLRAMSFHFPEGLAPVVDDTGAFHIDTHGMPRYAARYFEAYGFYDGVATVRDERGWFHIRANGSQLHDRRFRWSGNFQDGLCAVLDRQGFFHIDVNGADAYTYRFQYAGDYRHGIAVVHGPSGVFHVKRDGTPLNAAVYRMAEPFHKGHAVVADDDGFFHVNKRGQPTHPLRFLHAEPFYNGVSLCRGKDGLLVRLRENGMWTRIAENTKPIGIGEIREILRGGHKVGLFLRHAERLPITPATPNWGNDVLLTQRGIETAGRIGSELDVGGRTGFWSSPVMRCRQTCEAIARGAGVSAPTVGVHAHLGDPGIYLDGTGGHEEPMRRDFHAFASGYLDRGLAAGMRPIPGTSEELIAFIEQRMATSDCTLFITHDLFAAILMQYLGLKAPDKHDWCGYLEGVCLVAREGRISFHRFLGEQAVSPC